MSKQDTYTIGEFTKLSGLSRQHLYAGLWAKGLGPTRIVQTIGKGQRVLIDADSADAWLFHYWANKPRRGRKAATSSHKATQERTEHGHYQYAA